VRTCVDGGIITCPRLGLSLFAVGRFEFRTKIRTDAWLRVRPARPKVMSERRDIPHARYAKEMSECVGVISSVNGGLEDTCWLSDSCDCCCCDDKGN
jgi:hypothetical protein